MDRPQSARQRCTSGLRVVFGWSTPDLHKSFSCNHWAFCHTTNFSMSASIRSSASQFWASAGPTGLILPKLGRLRFHSLSVFKQQRALRLQRGLAEPWRPAARSAPPLRGSHPVKKLLPWATVHPAHPPSTSNAIVPRVCRTRLSGEVRIFDAICGFWTARYVRKGRRACSCRTWIPGRRGPAHVSCI